MNADIEILSPGALTSIRDLGRPGYTHLGISPDGAADTLALRVANRLVGNPEDTPGYEMTLLGGRFRFQSRASVALCGGEFDCGLPLWTTSIVEPEFELRVGGCRAGVRLYLAVNTEVNGLLKVAPYAYRKTLRVTPGADTAAFPADALERLSQGEWTVSDHSNRQGIRLIQGPVIEGAPGGGSQPSEGVALGAIQVPPDGQPVILFVDSQTTGGYPVVANVASVDLPSVAQLRPRDRVRFEPVSFEEAIRLFHEQEAWIRGIGNHD